jgi:hypothetical protein
MYSGREKWLEKPPPDGKYVVASSGPEVPLMNLVAARVRQRKCSRRNKTCAEKGWGRTTDRSDVRDGGRERRLELAAAATALDRRERER